MEQLDLFAATATVAPQPMETHVRTRVPEDTCAACGCTDIEPCLDEEGHVACSWAARDDAVCSRCKDIMRKAPCLGDELLILLGDANRRAHGDLQNLRSIHARVLGCSVDELDAVVAKRRVETKVVQFPPTTKAPERASPKAQETTPMQPVQKQKAPKKTEQALAMRRLTPRQQELLATMVIEDGRAVFGSDEVIADWASLKEVMLALGATYKRGGRGKGGTTRKGSFVFPADVDAEETLWLAREKGEILDPTIIGFFATPDAVADRAVAKVAWAPRMRVLEPSAGTGSLVRAIKRACPDADVLCVELLEKNQDELRRLGYEPVRRDFLQVLPGVYDPFDAVVMNPPFARGAECHHILHAARFVKPGGRLVSVVSRGVTFRKNAPYHHLATWLDSHGAVEDLPDNSFAAFGTRIRTSLLSARVCDGCRTGRCWDV